MTTSPNAAAIHAPFYADGTPGPDGRRIGVLLSHGFTGSPASMVPWGQYLAEQGYAVSVPLLPGHGTTWQEMTRTRYDDYYATLEREFETLKARTDAIVVAGLSMGGCLALQLTERRPGEIAGLVLVNPAVASTNKQLLALPVMQYLVRAFPGIGSDIKKAGAVEHAYDKTPLKPLASMLRAWKQVRADLAKVTVPVLLFRSAEDHVVDPSSARIILAGISSRDAAERVLANSYHVATLDNDAEQIFTESAEFIAKVAERNPGS
ncbi:MAG: alpha/beta fold hydrolase [Nocardioidaceae bacterium]|nr:alpha/beta fold hydrolase [Nocardioidaceae bacterium]